MGSSSAIWGRYWVSTVAIINSAFWVIEIEHARALVSNEIYFIGSRLLNFTTYKNMIKM